MQRRRVDGWAISVISALREQGIRVILLKGPAIARWLYPEDPWNRRYLDVDIFVGPHDSRRTDSLLRELGFTVWGNVLEVDENHARTYVRQTDSATIDLHRTLHGMEGVPAQVVWETLSGDPETALIRSFPVEIPNATVRTLNVALHLSPVDAPNSQPWIDLRRAIEQVDSNCWQAAIDLARSLGIEDELAPRLRRLTEGAALADTLELTDGASERYTLSAAVATGRASETCALAARESRPARDGVRSRSARCGLRRWTAVRGLAVATISALSLSRCQPGSSSACSGRSAHRPGRAPRR
jgi:hypothetical protein